MAAKTVKMADMSVQIASRVFQSLNSGKVSVSKSPFCYSDEAIVIITDTEPRDLVYPEGWYYEKGMFRNKHQSTTGLYEEIPMLKSNHDFWSDSAIYCTLNC